MDSVQPRPQASRTVSAAISKKAAKASRSAWLPFMGHDFRLDEAMGVTALAAEIDDRLEHAREHLGR